jgi:hypothetical protein
MEEEEIDMAEEAERRQELKDLLDGADFSDVGEDCECFARMRLSSMLIESG